MSLEEIDNSPKVPDDLFLSLVSFNILFGSPFPDYSMLRELSKDKERFDYIANTQIPSFKSDFCCLQEVVPRNLEEILANAYIRSNYYVSDLPSDLHGYDSFILSKYPFIIGGVRRLRIGLFQTQSNPPLVLCALHLVARESQHQMQRRYEEVKFIDRIFKNPESLKGLKPVEERAHRMIKQATAAGNIVCAGDMNFHNLCETDVLYEHGYEDVWLALRDLEPGYTWDPKMNQFIRLILPCDNRRMRLDRIFYSRKSEKLVFRDIQIVCNKPIPGLSKCCYKVYPSDHFGLKAHFQLTTNDQLLKDRPTFNYQEKRSLIIGTKNANTTGFRSVRTIICCRVLIAILVSLLIIGSAVVFVVVMIKLLK